MVINLMNLQYERDVNITHEISHINVRTNLTINPFVNLTSYQMIYKLREEYNIIL